ncbi:cofactor assembly of complex C subunit B [Synechocystis sp. LEGE 06083]|uniref:cofactor assembly of complex C subunit B n=1 Tax=Synechocystis sp. LEGE 06083 TaxID=915336 RepID=UPI001880AE8D|nr:cofactor assembly of complex C subunit B [Synechocystis sp. LEGE 06083]MBE9196075.1 cofactor assembly of complex C subunit B [Synechocystis sp. LEGE 06083]
MSADPNRIVRLLPLGAGTVGGLLLLINRLSTPMLTPSQARSDVVGVILAGMLVCVWLIWQRIQPKSPEAVVLEGKEGFDLLDSLPQDLKTELAWASHLLLTNTVTQTMVVYYDRQVLLRRGILSGQPEVKPGPIVERVMQTQKPVYLVNLPLYPGRVEFDYLPANTQGLICQPLGDRGVMILGANIPRSYTKQDENWVTGIADKIAHSLTTVRVL